MDTDTPADALADTIGHGNEVAGLNNDGGKAAGEDKNEDGGEAPGKEASLPKPKPKPNRIYKTVVFRKMKRFLSRHKKGQQKQTTHKFSAIRATIDINNANDPQIASAPVGENKLRYSHWSPTKEDVKRERRSLKGNSIIYKHHMSAGGAG